MIRPILIACLLCFHPLAIFPADAAADEKSGPKSGPQLGPQLGAKSGTKSAPKSAPTTSSAAEITLAPRTDVQISGMYPHLTTYGIYSQNGGHYKKGHNECGIGAIVPWAGKLWMVNYAPHQPRGSEHKLYSVDADLSQPLTIHPESVGGTPAGRMIHKESRQLLIGHHLVAADGTVRTIAPADMPMRVTAIARHLTDPANRVYYIDMEGAIWEANVHTLAVKRLFKKPVPGWHSKGGYTSQGRLVVSNNGELHVGDYSDVLVGGAAQNEEQRGVLAEYDGSEWRIVERRQFTEVTGPEGITGGSDGNAPLWSMGWDRRSVRLKVLDNGTWHTYLLPKAAHCNDASHGWYTEWPRIREITDDRWMMDMHGMFFDFPPTFSAANSGGIRPIGSHLRYVPDFCEWNGRLVLATDETSIQGNRLAGQPQSNLWFGTYEDLKTWGPASGYGGPWLEDRVRAGQPSDPFLVAGFDRRVIHLAVGRRTTDNSQRLRTTDQLAITRLPDLLAQLPSVTVRRGSWKKPAAGYTFEVDAPVTVYLAVDERGNPDPDDAWQRTEMTLQWGERFGDRVYSRRFAAGRIEIPGNSTEHTPGSFGLPHTAFVAGGGEVTVKAGAGAQLIEPPSSPRSSGPVTFTLETDRDGTGTWTPCGQARVEANGSVAHYLPQDFDGTWLRFTVDRDCVATAVLHQTTARFVDGSSEENQTLFAGLAEVGSTNVLAGRVYAAKRNRNLRLINTEHTFFEFTKDQFHFEPDTPDETLQQLLETEQEFTVDAASVVLSTNSGRFRLPKGDAAHDAPFASGWPRTSREVESERHLANIHGTFYEVPLLTNGRPPLWNLMRPVSSHNRQISDFCTWNGLLVLAGIRADAADDGHVFRDERRNVGLWFGGIDDLWKLGKPVGHGGPWLDTSVVAGRPSDAYLMRGYDRKSVRMSHGHSEAINVSLEVDISGNGLWVPYRSFNVPAGTTVNHQFPTAFSAFWVRAVSDTDTTATVQLDYR